MRHPLALAVFLVHVSSWLPGCRAPDILPEDTGKPPDTADTGKPPDTADTGKPPDTSDPGETADTGDSGVPGGPTAVATAEPGTGIVPFDVTLSGAASVAGDQPIARYEWRLADGSELDGEVVVATLAAEGSHTFTLTVVDEGGRSARDTVEVEASCPGFQDGVVLGTMRTVAPSGFVAASFAGTLWAHSDAQGEGPEIYAVSTSAALQGTFTLSGIRDTDWEDIARGPGPVVGVSYLYIADTGDNSETRSSVSILRFEEPSDPDGGAVTGVEQFTFTYPGGARDAETLLVDPLTGDVLLVEKDRSGAGESGIFLAEAPLDSSRSTELVKVGSLTFGAAPLSGDADATGGDVSADGRLVAVRTHDRVWLFARDVARPLHTAFENPVCGTPAVDGESKGEAFTFAPDGSGYYTSGEGGSDPLHWFEAR